jgi:hypothetical protein
MKAFAEMSGGTAAVWKWIGRQPSEPLLPRLSRQPDQACLSVGRASPCNPDRGTGGPDTREPGPAPTDLATGGNTWRLLDRMDIGAYGVRGVVATLELIQHHLAKMGHREPPCDPNLSRN